MRERPPQWSASSPNKVLLGKSISFFSGNDIIYQPIKLTNYLWIKMTVPINTSEVDFVGDIKALLHSARSKVYQTINQTMTHAYWEIGKRIVEEEQQGKARAKYGAMLIKRLSGELAQEFGKGFSIDNLKNMRRFYLRAC